jgi:hypothetical protein
MNIAILGASGTDAAGLLKQLQTQLGIADACTLCLASSQALLREPQNLSSLDTVNLVLLLGLQPGSAPALHRLDRALRSVLNQTAVPYALVLGTGAARVDNALEAIRYASDTPRTNPGASQWKWPCEKCSDPQCEHRLFSALLKTP